MKVERLKAKLGKEDFHYDMDGNFESITKNQKQNVIKKQLSEKQIRTLRDSSQATTQAKENQTKSTEEKIYQTNST